MSAATSRAYSQAIDDAIAKFGKGWTFELDWVQARTKQIEAEEAGKPKAELSPIAQLMKDKGL